MTANATRGVTSGYFTDVTSNILLIFVLSLAQWSQSFVLSQFTYFKCNILRYYKSQEKNSLLQQKSTYLKILSGQTYYKLMFILWSSGEKTWMLIQLS